MDVDSEYAAAASNVDDWFACFSQLTNSKPATFPFTSHKIQCIESRRARMSDLLIFDVLLIRGGIRSPDILFPPVDWAALKKLLDVVDQSVYDVLKKDCLVYILLKWAWDMDSRETNAGWDVRYLQDRCIPPQFATLADAYWLLDTGSHLGKAVSILSDARLNRDYASKILQALALSSSPASFASGTSRTTAALVVKYVRTAKPLLTEPDDIDLYALSLAQLSFMDAWAYQNSFPEGSDTRERLLRKIVAWCLMPTPKQDPLAQLLSFPLSSYEQAFLHALALPRQFSTSSSLSSTHTTATSSNPVLSSRAISILQDLLCVRAIQSGDYVGAIKLDREISSVSPSLGNGVSPNNTSQSSSSGRDTIDRKSIIQDLFSALPPPERTLLEDEIGKVAMGVRADTQSMQRQGPSATRRPLMAEMSLSASWEDVGSVLPSPVRSTSLSPAVSAGVASKTTPAPVSMTGKVTQSPFAPRVPRPKLASTHQTPLIPKFTAFGSPIPTTGLSTGRSIITERNKTFFSTSATGGPSTSAKPAAHVSLFDTAGSAKKAPNAFYKPPSAQAAITSLDVGSALASSTAAKNVVQDTSWEKNTGDEQGGEDGVEDVSMGTGSDVEIVEDHRGKGRGEEQDEETRTEEDDDDEGNFIAYDKSSAADLTFHRRDVDEAMDEDEGLNFGFSVFSGSKSATQNGSAGRHGKRRMSGNGHAPYASPPPRAHVSPSREEESPNISINSTTTSRWRAPPGAFHNEEDDEDQNENQDRNASREGHGHEEGHQTPQITPVHSPRRRTRTSTQTQTPSRVSTRSQPRRSSKTATADITLRPSGCARPRPSRTIPGALMDEDNDDQGQVDEGHTDEDTEMDEQEEEDDVIAPLPSRSSRRTRSSGLIGTSSKSKPDAKSSAPARATNGTDIGGPTKAKVRSSEARTPARRSSRLSTASSQSPERTEVVSPIKKGRSSGSRASIAGSGSGTVATRSSARRKR